MRKIWPFTFYFLYFASLSSLIPFFVLFYQGLGFTGTQIGLLTGIPPLITLIASPFWTGIADARHLHKFVMGLGILGTVVVIFLLPMFASFALVFATIILFNMFLSPVSALSDSATMNMLGTERAMYGRIRLGGTIGWGFFAPVAGFIVQSYGLRVAFWTFCVVMLLNFFISRRFVFFQETTTTNEASRGGIRALVTTRRWINFLFLAFLGGVGSFSAASYLFPYMAELGANESTMGIALTIATLTEIPAFFFGNRLLRRFGSYGLLLLALVMVAIRSLLYGVVSTPAMVLVVQAFGGMIFPMIWLAGVSYADENAPAGLKSSAQGLFGAMTFGVGSAAVGFAGGLLLESIGGRGMFFVLGLFIFTGLALAEGIRRFVPEKSELPQPVALSSDK